MSKKDLSEIWTSFGVFPHYRWVFPGRDNRTKEESPYAYSDHYLWGVGEDVKGVQGLYHDRMREWNAEKWNAAWETLDGTDLRTMSREQASTFMSTYLGKNVDAVGVSEGCNQSSGYPYWVIYFKEKS